MKQVLSILVFVLVLSACKKNNGDSPAANEIYGRYTGTFNRTGMDTVSVSLHFKNDNSFEGTSGGALNYPAICSGSFQQSSKNLLVNDSCTWTANFDWTLIFDGSYYITFTGPNSVRIWRTTQITTDEYLLNRISR